MERSVVRVNNLDKFDFRFNVDLIADSFRGWTSFIVIINLHAEYYRIALPQNEDGKGRYMVILSRNTVEGLSIPSVF